MKSAFTKRYLIQFILIILGFILGWLVSFAFSFDETWSNVSKLVGVVLLPSVYFLISSRRLLKGQHDD